MKLIITESTLKNLTKTLINEKLGVPNNIHEEALELYNSLIISFTENNNKELENKNTFVIYPNIQIDDFILKKINIYLNLYPYVKTDYIDLASMAVGNKTQNGVENDVIKYAKNDYCDMKIDLVYPINEKIFVEDIVNFFISNKNKIIQSFSHELKHLYDKFKNENENIKTLTQYQTYTELSSGVRVIDKFFFFLYFITNIENLVRPTELASQIKSENITKKQFLNFFNNNNEIKLLKKIKNWSYEKYVKELYNNTNQLYNFLLNVDPNYDLENEDDIVQETLDVIRITAIENFVNNYYLYNSSNIEGLNKVNNYKNKLTNKFKKPNDFFKYNEKLLNLKAEKMLKKLSKLYDMAKNNEEINENNKKVINPNLYNEINKDISKFVKPPDVKKSEKSKKNSRKKI